MTMQTPGLKNSSPGMTDTGQIIIRATKQEWKTGFSMKLGRGDWDIGVMWAWKGCTGR